MSKSARVHIFFLPPPVPLVLVLVLVLLLLELLAAAFDAAALFSPSLTREAPPPNLDVKLVVLLAVFLLPSILVAGRWLDALKLFSTPLLNCCDPAN